MKETPEEFLTRINNLVDESSYRYALYGEFANEDPDETEFPSLPDFPEEDFDPEEEERRERPPTPYHTRLDLPEEVLNSWRADCPRFPYEVPCDSCIYEHFNQHNYFIGGPAHGQEVSQSLTHCEIIRVPVPPVSSFMTSSPSIEELIEMNTEVYEKRFITVILPESSTQIAIWVLESLTSPVEAFEVFRRFAQRGE